ANCCQLRGALLPHPFTLTIRRWRSALCCTFRRLAPPRRYLAFCPMEPGLSSPAEARATAWPTPGRTLAKFFEPQHAAYPASTWEGPVIQAVLFLTGDS